MHSTELGIKQWVNRTMSCPLASSTESLCKGQNDNKVIKEPPRPGLYFSTEDTSAFSGAQGRGM